MGRSRNAAWWVAWLGAAYLVTHFVSAAAGEALPGGAQTTAELFQKVAPSVVTIRARGRDVMSGGQTRLTETGSGVLVSRDGHVLTAAHVVHGMDEISVEFPSGVTVSARVVASEPTAADVSLLQLDDVPPGSIVAPMADSNTVKVRDKVLVVGAPAGLPPSASVGSISARWAPNTVYLTMPLAEFFETDVTIDTGNSGGPMFNLQGEIIGIVSLSVAKGDRSEWGSFAVVTLNTTRELLLGARPMWLGATLSD
jgi:serine protease Do